MESQEPLLTAGEGLRIVLFGRADVKESAGKILLSTEDFEPPETCKVGTAFIKTANGETQKVTVVDTPLLFLSSFSCKNDKRVLKEFKKSISLAPPGPHVFLIVLDGTDRFTQEQRKMVKLIRNTFGKNTMAYTMVLFCFTSKLENPIEDYFCKPRDPRNPRKLSELHNVIIQCHWKYHVFDNTGNPEKAEKEDQVKSLLEKINCMIKTRGKDTYYTREMLQQAKKDPKEALKDKTESDEAEIAEIEGKNEAEKMAETASGEQRIFNRDPLEIIAYIGFYLGCLIGYFVVGGEFTANVGAAIGGFVCGLLAFVMGILVIIGKDSIKAHCIKKRTETSCC